MVLLIYFKQKYLKHEVKDQKLMEYFGKTHLVKFALKLSFCVINFS